MKLLRALDWIALRVAYGIGFALAPIAVTILLPAILVILVRKLLGQGEARSTDAGR